MNFLRELWSVIASGAISWFASVENEVLSKISNLLTILVITLGLIDWLVRKLRKRANNKQAQNLEANESTETSFKVVNMLNNPMGAGEKIGALIDDTTKILGGGKMKKFFKWLWYNKEQLLSIVYNAAIIVAVNFLMWTDILNGVLASFAGEGGVLAIKIGALVLAVLSAALTVRNVCVTYGLSSLDTIDKVLAEKAADAEKKLTPEQKKIYKTNITILQNALDKAREEMKTAVAGLEKITALYNADSSLVPDFVRKRQQYEGQINASKVIITNLEGKIAVYKAALNGNNTESK